MKYNVDFSRLVLGLLPTFLRKRGIYALLRTCADSIEKVYKAFRESRDRQNYDLAHNGQVCYLRKVLNDTFKTSHFDIEDVEVEGEWRYAKSEDLTQHLYAVSEPERDNEEIPILYDEIALTEPRTLFVVRVPMRIYDTQLEQVKAIVENYRLVTKTPIYTPTGA